MVRLVNRRHTTGFHRVLHYPHMSACRITREKLAVDVTSVVDVHDVNPMSLFIYLVVDAVAAPSGGPEPGELAP
jgi:hypothetical protein